MERLRSHLYNNIYLNQDIFAIEKSFLYLDYSRSPTKVCTTLEVEISIQVK